MCKTLGGGGAERLRNGLHVFEAYICLTKREPGINGQANKGFGSGLWGCI